MIQAYTPFRRYEGDRGDGPKVEFNAHFRRCPMAQEARDSLTATGLDNVWYDGDWVHLYTTPDKGDEVETAIRSWEDEMVKEGRLEFAEPRRSVL